MRFGGWYRLSKRGGVFVSTTVPHHTKRQVTRVRAHAATHPRHYGIGCLLWLLIVGLIVIMLVVR